MESKELRIGNLVTTEWDKDEFFVVTCIDDTDCSVILEDDGSQDEILLVVVKPIPLSEYWLVKAGFEKEEEYEFGVLICYRYILETRKTNCVFTSNYSTEECIYVNYNQGGVDIEYVHQLQNLYFALTGTELTFNHQNQIK